MEKIGTGLAETGFTINKFVEVQNKVHLLIKEHENISGVKCDFSRLEGVLSWDDTIDADPATVLIIRNDVNLLLACRKSNKTANDIFAELNSFEWDAKYWDRRRSKVLNKRARHNVCFGNVAQKADFENKKGTIISYKDIPSMALWKTQLELLLDENYR